MIRVVILVFSAEWLLHVPTTDISALRTVSHEIPVLLIASSISRLYPSVCVVDKERVEVI